MHCLDRDRLSRRRFSPAKKRRVTETGCPQCPGIGSDLQLVKPLERGRLLSDAGAHAALPRPARVRRNHAVGSLPGTR